MCVSSYCIGQFTSQRTFSYGDKYFSKNFTLQIPGDGYLAIVNYLNAYDPSGPSVYDSNSVILLRINENYDTIWSKRIKQFNASAAMRSSDGNIIITGTKHTNLERDTLATFSILKISPAGEMIAQQAFEFPAFLFTTAPTYPVALTGLTELANGQLFILFCLSFNNQQTASSKMLRLTSDLQPLVMRELTVDRNSNSDFKLKGCLLQELSIQQVGNNRLCISNKGNFETAFYSDIEWLNRIIEVDTNMNIMLHKRLANDNEYIKAVFSIHPAEYIINTRKQFGFTALNGAWYARANFNTGNQFKSIGIYNTFKQNAAINGLSYWTYMLDDAIYAISNSDFYSNGLASIQTITDSGSHNFRYRIFKIDTNLTVRWYKRLHAFGFSVSVPPIPISATNGIYGPINRDVHLHLKGNRLSLISTKQPINNIGQDPATPEAVTRNQTGIFVTELDSSGATANCNITDEQYKTLVDSIRFEDQPLFTYSDATFRSSSFRHSVDAFGVQAISDTCLPLRKPVANFGFAAVESLGFADSIVCINNAFNLFERSFNEPREWKWIFPPQADISAIDSTNFPELNNIRFRDTGRFPIRLVVINAGGSDTMTRFIQVNDFIPQPKLGNDTTVCAGDSLLVIYRNPPNSSHYFVGPNVFTEADSLVIREDGEYICVAYSPCGYAYDTINVRFSPGISPGFQPLIECNNLLVSFVDTSSLNGNEVPQYAWKFLDKNNQLIGSSNLQNPSFQFPSFDQYRVQFTVRSQSACRNADSLIRDIQLKAKPQASFSASNACNSLAVSFSSSSSVAGDVIAHYSWTFSDGQSSLLANPVVNFTGYDEITAKLEVRSSLGCASDSTSQRIQLKKTPTIAIFSTADSSCIARPFSVTSSASLPNADPIASFGWSLNGVEFTSNLVVTQTPTTPGIYVFRHWATNAAGCTSDTAFKTITIVGKPTASFTFANNCGSRSIPFIAASSVANDVITQHYWSFGDNSFSTQQSPVKTYAAFADAYTVRYAATSSIGCTTDTVVQTVAVKDRPTASISPINNACENQPFIVQGSSTVNNASITNRQWWLNNTPVGTNSNNISLTQPAGTYQLKYLATSNQACNSDTALLNITVDALPVASFSTTNVCTGQPLPLQNNSAGPSNTYKWYFGNGDSSTAVVPAYQYPAPGNYIIRLMAATPNNCVAIATQPITIAASPKASFTFTESCIGKPINISNNSSNATQYSWVSSDGQRANTAAPAIVYAVAGNYNLQLVASSSNGCRDSVSKTLALQLVHLTTTNDTTILTDQPLQLQANGANSYTWQPADQLSSSNIASPIFKATNGGAYTINVTGITAQGCKDSRTITITVVGNAPGLLPSAFSPNGDSKNPYFRFNCAGMRTLNYFRIFNRYGQTIYDQRGCNAIGWDGSYKGVAQNPGAYVYIWQGTDFTGSVRNGKGTVVLVR